MKHLAIILVLMTAAAAPASAQILPQITNPVPPVPQPPPPPPPSLAVPPVPKMDAPPPTPSPKGQGRRSFNDRIDDCLTDFTAARLDTTERAVYVRVCANR